MKTFVSYLVFNPLLCVNACEHATNPYILVDFCECEAHTRRLASVGLAQAHPNKVTCYIATYITYADIF